MKNGLIYISLIFLSVFSYGQVNISIDSDKNDYNGKDLVNLTIILEMNGSEYNQQTPIRLPDLSKFNIIESGSINNTYIDPETNTVNTRRVSQISLEPKQKGKIKIGSVLVTVNNRIYKTEPFEVFVRDIEKKSFSGINDLFLNMEIEDRDIYKNQPTVAVLKAYSKNMDNFRKVKNIHLPQQKNINVHPINFNKSEIEPANYGNMASQVLAVFMIFPNEAGYIEVPSVSASVRTYNSKEKINSNRIKMNVKKLPEGSPKYFKNAVGTFKVSLFTISKDKIEAKKPIHIAVKVIGEGNLTDMELPRIAESPDYKIFSPKITTKSSPGSKGMKGEVLSNYVVVPNHSGTFTVKTEPFAFFDPETREYVNAGQKRLALDVLSEEQVLEERSTVERVNDYTNTLLETVNTPVLKTNSFKVKEKSKFQWNTLLINIGILSGLFLIYVLFKMWQKKRVITKQKAKREPLGSVAETEQEIREKLGTDIKDYFSYLEMLKDNREYSKFFQIVDEMDFEVRKQYNQSSTEEFRASLEKQHGFVMADEYDKVSEKIQIEKYIPIKSTEGIDELLKAIINLYSSISK